jgi:predicted ribosomally synthesized peptide with SipW-like signal peptide
MKQKRMLKIGSLLLSIVLMITSLGGISAYFTDTDTAVNTFEFGEVSIELQEPNWPGTPDTTPNSTTQKDPQIYNDGRNQAYVFMEVVVPYQDNLNTVNSDGSVNAAARTELFNYEVNDGWAKVQSTTDEVNGVIKHVYAYVGNDASKLEPLAPRATTPTLFDEIKFVNAIENQGLEDSELNVVVNAYAIQTNDINGGKTAPQDVWHVITNTGISNNKPTGTAIPVQSTDKNGNDLNATSTEIVGAEKDDLLNKLEESGLVNSSSDVDAIIEVESDEFDNLAATTFDVSEIAQEGDKVIILHFDESKQEWEFISEEIVDANGKVTADFSSYSPVAFVVVKADGTTEIIGNKQVLMPGLYQTGALDLYQSEGADAISDMMIKSWSELIADGTVQVDGNAFIGCQYETAGELFLPSDDSITSIGKYAFSECMSLTGVFIPKSVNSIGWVCFEYCDYYDNLSVLFEDPDYWYVTTTENATHGINVNIEDAQVAADLLSNTYCSYWWYKYPTFDGKNDDGTIDPGLYAHGSNYTVLKASWETLLDEGVIHVTNGVVTTNYDGEANESGERLYGDLVLPFDGTVTALPDQAFCGCGILTNVVIQNGVTTIGSSSFSNCTSLISINIPASVTNISNLCSNAPRLQAINVDENNLNYCSVDGVLFTKDMLTIMEYPEGKGASEYRIPYGVTTVGSMAFTYCDGLNRVIIPDSVSNIGTNAFYYCSDLDNVAFENSANWQVEKDGQIYTDVNVADEAEAATLLSSTYRYAIWTRSDS